MRSGRKIGCSRHAGCHLAKKEQYLLCLLQTRNNK